MPSNAICQCLLFSLCVERSKQPLKNQGGAGGKVETQQMPLVIARIFGNRKMFQIRSKAIAAALFRQIAIQDRGVFSRRGFKPIRCKEARCVAKIKKTIDMDICQPMKTP